MENIEHIQQADPAAYIEGIRGEISVMGANDTEFSTLDSILKQWQNRQISDAEAINQAAQVREAKQDYH